MTVPTGEEYHRVQREFSARRKRREPIDLRTELEDLPELMTEAEVADYLRITLKKLRRLRYEKQGPRTRLSGADARIYKADFVEWLTEL